MLGTYYDYINGKSCEYHLYHNKLRGELVEFSFVLRLFLPIGFHSVIIKISSVCAYQHMYLFFIVFHVFIHILCYA